MMKLKLNNLHNPPTSLQNTKPSEFLHLLTTKWDEIHREGSVFRYKISNIKERYVNGKYLLQLNPDRGTKRRIPEQINDICQPFDANKFNFTKVSPKEILFSIESEDMHTILVNVSPISQYHSLLCPSVNRCLPQIVTMESLQLALSIIFLVQNRDLRIGFNSLCGLASVNHLHYHIFLEKNTLPIETVKCKHLKGSLYYIEDYPIPAFCLEVNEHSINEIAKDAYTLVKYLLNASIAHNIFITRGEGITMDSEVVRIVVWPRRSTVGVKQLDAFNVAVCELSGWFPVYGREDYEKLKQEDLENELKTWKINNFNQLCDNLKLLF